VLHGVDSSGDPETVVIWIERKEGGVWAVGRAVNPDRRESKEPRPEDYVFEGYELGTRCRGERDARGRLHRSRSGTATPSTSGRSRATSSSSRSRLVLRPLVKLTLRLHPVPERRVRVPRARARARPAPFEVEPVLLDIEELNRRAAGASSS
jgi:hypothetical protein